MQFVEKSCSTLENFDKEFQKIEEKNSIMNVDQHIKLHQAKEDLLNLVNQCEIYIKHTKFVGDEDILNINLKEIEENLFKNNIVDTEKFKSLAKKVWNILDLLDKSIKKELDNSKIGKGQVAKKKEKKFRRILQHIYT